MDIQLKKKPWIVRYWGYVVAGMAFVSISIYAGALAFGKWTPKIDADDCRIAEVVETPFMEYVDVEGIVLPIQTILVNSLESGFVERIVAEEGAMLHKGDTILVLSNVSLQRTIEDEAAEWANQQRNYREQEIEMEQRSITLRQQALDADHQMKSLEKSMKQSREEYRMGIKSKAELEVAEEDYEYQRKRVALQMQSLRHDSVATNLRREMVIANRDASSRKLARTVDRTGNLIVRSPIDGQLSFLNVTLGQQVTPGGNIGEIKVMSEYKTRVSLPEYYIDRITTGLRASIKYNDSVFPMRISKVVPEIKERNFSCDLVFTCDKPSNIRIGKSYRVQIELASPEEAIVIPRGDFYQKTSGEWIYKLTSDGKNAVKTEIEIGRQNPREYEVVGGLMPGDKVIVSGYERLGEYDAVILK